MVAGETNLTVCLRPRPLYTMADEISGQDYSTADGSSTQDSWASRRADIMERAAV